MKLIVITLFSMTLFFACTPITDIPTADTTETDNITIGNPGAPLITFVEEDISATANQSVGELIKTHGYIEIIEGNLGCAHTLFHPKGKKSYDLIGLPEISLETGDEVRVMGISTGEIMGGCVEEFALKVLYIAKVL